MNAEEVSEYSKLIDKLQRDGKGDSKDLDNIKRILIKDKNLEEAYVRYLRVLDEKSQSRHDRLQGKQDRPLITTTETIQGKIIEEYFGIVSGHAVLGMDFFTDLIGGFRDFWGGRSETLESYFLDAREMALDGMAEEALDYGANAIVAVRFNDVSMEGKDRQMALVTVHGTAVKIKDEILSESKN